MATWVKYSSPGFQNRQNTRKTMIAYNSYNIDNGNDYGILIMTTTMKHSSEIESSSRFVCLFVCLFVFVFFIYCE